MAKIRILPEVVANRIAAGEVVERPASVLKELIENALDAGATAVDVLIKNAGKHLIQVIDNGTGMTKEDLLLAFERYATSKIERFEDLETLSTFGFRGEALPSIASVSRVEVKTKTYDSEHGWFLAIEGGKIVRVDQVVIPNGSNFSVKNLFFNVPARRRFLKSNATESSHLINRFKKFALANPTVKFSLTLEEECIYQLTSGNIEERIAQLYSGDILNDLHPIAYQSDIIQLSGFVGNANLLRSQRGEQHLFLNQRAIRSPFITSAVISGLGQIVEPGKYPFYILFLHLSPRHFDVNVHPSKEEVKFDDEGLVRKVVSDAVRDGLRSGGLEKPPVRIGESRATGHSQKPSEFHTPEQRRETSIFQPPTIHIPKSFSRGEYGQQTMIFPPRFDENVSSFGDFETTKKIIQSVELEQSHFWQVQDKYIFVSIPSGVAIIDQHVAHERILYERALKMLKSTSNQSQVLMFPLQFTVRIEDALTAKELQSDLKKIGFLIDVPDHHTIILQGVPQDLKLENEKQVLLQMLDLYRSDISARPDQEDRLAATFACKAAIKAGTPLSLIEMKQLVHDLLECELPYVCPHGRPIILQLTIEELDRRFGRNSG